MQETGNLVVGWILQLREILAMASLCFLLWYLVAKLIPYLMDRERDRAERDNTRWDKAVDKLGEVVKETAETQTEVVKELNGHMHQMLVRLEEMSRGRRGSS